jgi:hypothetical protein
MEYIGLLVIVIIITLLWFVNYQNHCQNQKIGELTQQINDLTYVMFHDAKSNRILNHH